VSEFRYVPKSGETVDTVLDGVKRMLERMRFQECPKDPVEARSHKLALSCCQRAVPRGVAAMMGVSRSSGQRGAAMIECSEPDCQGWWARNKFDRVTWHYVREKEAR
jgi:hypothetical protein